MKLTRIRAPFGSAIWSHVLLTIAQIASSQTLISPASSRPVIDSTHLSGQGIHAVHNQRCSISFDMRLAPLLLPLLFTLPLTGTSIDPADTIRQLVQQYLAARNQNDVKALQDLFVPDADQLVSTGEWRKGRDAVVTGTLQSSQRTGGHRTITVESVRLVNPDVAVADGRYELTGLSTGETRQMWSTFVLVRTAAGWRIAAIRNMLPATPVPIK